MPVTRYYDPNDARGARCFTSLLTWHATIFELVLCRGEFYAYIFWNLAVTSVVIFAVQKGVIEEFNWDAASIMQYVMTFFVTFYNDKCFERYSLLYPACTDFMDNVIYLVQEMNVSLPWRDLHYHRIAVCKYLLAAVYEHFMIVCGGKLQPKSWEEFIKKGLLSKEEVKMLQQCPSGESTFVLTSWVLFILRDALVQDCMWRRNEDNKDWQPQQTVHIFNRHCQYVIEMQTACHRIGYTMANPIPFAYYHLMNVILVFNIILLATCSALFRSYASVFPFAVALLVYMGMREISTALADPFGQDSIDFPVPDFLRACFDNTTAQLLAFLRFDVRERLLLQIEDVKPFQDHHLRRFCKQSLFAPDDSPMKGTATHIRWQPKSCFEDAAEDIDIGQKMKYSFSPKEFVEPDTKVEDIDPKKKAHIRHHDMKQKWKASKKEAIRAQKDEKVIHETLEAEIKDLEAEYNKCLASMDKLIDAYPKLHECGPAVLVREDLGEAGLKVAEENALAELANAV